MAVRDHVTIAADNKSAAGAIALIGVALLLRLRFGNFEVHHGIAGRSGYFGNRLGIGIQQMIVAVGNRACWFCGVA
jgi:hypothetical protein